MKTMRWFRFKDDLLTWCWTILISLEPSFIYTISLLVGGLVKKSEIFSPFIYCFVRLFNAISNDSGQHSHSWINTHRFSMKHKKTHTEEEEIQRRNNAKKKQKHTHKYTRMRNEQNSRYTHLMMILHRMQSIDKNKQNLASLFWLPFFFLLFCSVPSYSFTHTIWVLISFSVSLTVSLFF